MTAGLSAAEIRTIIRGIEWDEVFRGRRSSLKSG